MAGNIGGEMVRDALYTLREELIDAREKLATIEAGADVRAMQLTGLPFAKGAKDKMSGRLYYADKQRARIARAEADIRTYISCAERPEYVRLLQLRYVQLMEWESISTIMYGVGFNHSKQNAFRRRLFRMHKAACSEIWRNFQPSQKKEGRGSK